MFLEAIQRLKRETMFKINLPVEEVETVLTTWKQLHWNVSETYDWPYGSDNIGIVKEL